MLVLYPYLVFQEVSLVRKHVISHLLTLFVILLFAGFMLGSGGLGTPPGSTISPSGTTSPGSTISPGRTVSPAVVTSSTSGSSTTTMPTTPVMPALAPSAALIASSALNNTKYVVFAWNDLGMHCANDTYDKAVLLPPYNTLWVQIIMRGNPPKIVTSGLTVEYKFINNTYSYGKKTYGQFWDNARKLFGLDLPKDSGLNLIDPTVHNALSGKMLTKADYFEATGIPLTPINDDGTWNPFQVAEITVKDPSAGIVAQTYATAPISSEINCAKCHGSDPFQNILEKHDKNVGTKLVAQEPVLCASCHGDPALGVPDAGPNQYLSKSIHGFHAGLSTQPNCYDCHPGTATQCSRSLAHTAADGNCVSCHGDLTRVSSSISSGRTPWATEPKCVTCHAGVAEVDTGDALYRNSKGHGGVYCASCHSSPHAMVPTSILSDNYQALQYQGVAKAIGSCGACHGTSKDQGESNDFMETHGGTNPQVANACNICHTSTPTDTAQWPHAFQWTPTQGTGSIRQN